MRERYFANKSNSERAYREVPVAPRPDAKFAYSEFRPDLRGQPRTAVKVYNPELLFRRPEKIRPPIFYAAMRGFSLAESTCRGIKFDLALVSVWACKKVPVAPRFFVPRCNVFPLSKGVPCERESRGF